MVSSFRRIAALVLLAAGVALVFTGFSAALGFTLTGVVASLAAVATLLYAGATWFGGSNAGRPAADPLPQLLVFDRHRRIVGGSGAGQPLTSQFPEILRPEIDRRCESALAGTSGRFPCLHNGRMVMFDALPVRSADGAVVCGVLLIADAEAAAMVAHV